MGAASHNEEKKVNGKTKLEMDENEQKKTSTLKFTVIYEADRSC